MLKKSPAAIAAVLCALVWISFAALMPVVQDEAYYFMWSKFIGAGFFDHPPIVAFMSYGNQLFHGSLLGSRAGTIVTALLSLLAAIRLFRIYGLKDQNSLMIAVVFCQFNLLGLIGGFLTTPDTALILFWILGVSESYLALNGQRWRWLTAGLFTGLGLWSKYTMLIIGLVFLWGLIRETLRGRKSNGLLSPMPYLGGIIALAVFLPHVVWNAEHDWITFKFQLRHGLALDRPELAASHLPAPEIRYPDGPEIALASAFQEIIEAQEEEELKPKPWEPILKKLNIYLGFYSSQLALWGLLAVPLIAALIRRRRRGSDRHAVARKETSTGSRHLIIASVAVPLIVFGLLSLVSKVEANWSAMYIVGAAALIGRHLSGDFKKVRLYATANVALIAIVILHARTGILPIREHRDRILAETHGYKELAGLTQNLGSPVFSDSYQIASMLRFYRPDLEIRQWPGITRDSEYLRRPELANMNFENLMKIGSFWLITTEQIPPKIKGFKPIEMAQLRDCKDGGIQVIKASAAHDYENRCKKLIHDWYLLNYTTL